MKRKILTLAACGTLSVFMSACSNKIPYVEPSVESVVVNIDVEHKDMPVNEDSTQDVTKEEVAKPKIKMLSVTEDARKILRPNVEDEEVLPAESVADNTSNANTTNNNNNNTSTTPPPSNNNNYNTWDTLVGKLSIPSVGLSVNCYASASQATVDAANSAAYFYTQGHLVIGDHVNQGFNKIKSCSKGTIAYIPYGGSSVEYECVAVMNGINTGYSLTTADGRDIRDLYPGAVVCYTCNSNWQNVTLVFFQIPGTSVEELEDENSEFYPGEDVANTCPAGQHDWSLEETFDYVEITDDYRIKYRRNHYICNKCNSDWLETSELARWDIDDKDWWKEDEPEEPSVPEETEPESPPPENTEPPVETPTEPDDTVPPEDTEPTVPEIVVPDEPTTPTDPVSPPEDTDPPVVEPTPPVIEDPIVTEPPVIVPEPEPDLDPEPIVDPNVSEQEE